MTPTPASAARSRDTQGVAARVTSTRFVGRAKELAELEAAWRDASAGRPSLAFIAGESGVGKTRLVAELERRVRELGGRVVGGDCVELGEGELPYAPIVAALRPLARDRDPALATLPPAARTALARLLPSLGEAGGAGGDDDADAQGRVFEALLALLARLGEEKPLLVTVEDVHWADRSTRSFLAFIASSLCTERVLLVATYRPDELHRRHPLRPLLAELERDVRARRIELAPFDRAELADALTDILGAPPAEELVERLFARSEGNALYTEELLAASLDGRGPLPPTLRDALMLRIEGLPPAAQDVLRVLAVGRRLDHATLADASGMEARELREALRETAAANIVVTDADGRYAFRHALLREVAHDDLLPGEHAELHLALARALERRAAEEGAGVHLSAGIALHYTEAGDRPAALAASLRAAAAADRVHAPGEAAALLERVLELWDRVPDAEALAGADRAEVLTRAADAHFVHGHRVRAETLLNAALAQVDEEADPRRAARLLERLSHTQWGLNRSQDALASARRAVALLPADEPTAERAHLHAWWAKIRMLQGRYGEAVAEAEDALQVADAVGERSAAGAALNALGISLMSLGETERGAEHLREAIRAARAADRLGDLGSAYVNLADSFHLVGRTDEALAMAHEARRSVEGLPHNEQWVDTTISELAFDAGDWETAFSALPSPRRYVGSLLLYVDLRRAEHELALGDHDAAAATLARLEPVADSSTEPQFHAPLGALLAELHRRRGDLDAAADAVEVALDRIEFCTEDVSRIARIGAAGVTVEADRAERARDLGDDDVAQAAVARAEAFLLRVEAAALAHRPVEQALHATAQADMARARGEQAPEAWASAAAAWEAVGRPYPAALARLREAEAHVGAGDRDAAADAACAALAAARRLGARWLEDEVQGLAARARLRVEGAADAPDPEAGPADHDDDPFGLTPRERQVLALVAEGRTNREIGAELYMAEKTASVHVSRILAKLDVRSRTEAAAVAHRLGLDGAGAQR
jgi:DNA-binding CsgD family transcriptional regulator/tetratricopeptide (TPR) repeat protein